MVDLVSGEEVESEYAQHFKSHGRGEVALNVRIVLRALLIKEILGLSNREVVESVIEKSYLQYFLGFKNFQMKALFCASLLMHLGKRLFLEVVMSLNDKIIESARKSSNPEDDPSPDRGGVPLENSNSSEAENSGAIQMDATYTPADVKLNLVNEARELTETVIDKLGEQCVDRDSRPRTTRKICRRRYLEIIKHPKYEISKRRGALCFLLNAIHQNLEFIAKLCDRCGNIPQIISDQLIVIRPPYDQQRTMRDNHSRRIDDRIVSLYQLPVHPIVHGKAGHETEFVAKLTANVGNEYARTERLSWNAYNEGGDLQMICERYRVRTGHYPEAVLAAKLFCSWENLRYCAEHGIRLSGLRLRRPAKIVNPEFLKQQLADNLARNAIEGKFGHCKQRFGYGSAQRLFRNCYRHDLFCRELDPPPIRNLFSLPIPSYTFHGAETGHHGVFV